MISCGSFFPALAGNLPTHVSAACENLRISQQLVQFDKERARVLSRYDWLLFRRTEAWFREYVNDDIIGHYEQILSAAKISDEIAGKPPSLLYYLQAVAQIRKRNVIWVDLGGGIGLPMRQISHDHAELASKLKMINVDLFDWQSRSDAVELLEHVFRRVVPTVLEDVHAPELVVDDLTIATFGGKADLITSIESIQYVENKLKAVVNAYNQLEDGGILMVYSSAPFGLLVETQINDSKQRFETVERFFEILAANGISVLRSPQHREEDFLSADIIALIRKPGTKLDLLSKLDHSELIDNGYVKSFYTPSNKPIRVIKVHE